MLFDLQRFGGKGGTTVQSTYQPTEHEMKLQKLEADYTEAIMPNAFALNSKAKNLLDSADAAMSSIAARVVEISQKSIDEALAIRENVKNGMEEHTERLVIIIDAVDQLFDDVYKNNLSFIPSNLSDKVQLIFSCLDNFPTVGIPTIDVQLLNADNKSEIIKGILDSSEQLLEDFCVELIELAAEIFGSFITLVVNYIAISRYGLRESDLEGILLNKNVEWNALNFSVFTKYLSNFFIQREDGRIDFAHKNIRAGILKQLGDENILQFDIFGLLENL